MKSIEQIARAMFTEYLKRIDARPGCAWETADERLRRAWIAVAQVARREIEEVM